MRRVPVFAVLVLMAGALVLPQTVVGASPVVPDAPVAGTRTGFLSSCASLADRARERCYVRGLTAEAERLGNPATGLPLIDRKVHQVGGFLEAACHALMHEVGRTWARRHAVTIETLYRFVPRSNDPGCSAGFGMGMSMYLGPKLIADPRSLLKTCTRLPTRFREYTCVHGAGHAFMRGYHGLLRDAMRACDTLGRYRAPDCSQGAFHDYWISIGGGDGTMAPANADTSPQSLCDAYAYKRPCWFRYFWERKPSTRVASKDDLLELCDDLGGLHRAGCLSGASLLASRERDPVDHARLCGELTGTDTYNCLRGVNVPALANKRFEHLRLIRTCGGLPTSTRWWCFGWFGRTLSVLTDGRFRDVGCVQLRPVHAAVSCAAGGSRMGRPLLTFS